MFSSTCIIFTFHIHNFMLLHLNRKVLVAAYGPLSGSSWHWPPPPLLLPPPRSPLHFPLTWTFLLFRDVAHTWERVEWYLLVIDLVGFCIFHEHDLHNVSFLRKTSKALLLLLLLLLPLLISWHSIVWLPPGLMASLSNGPTHFCPCWRLRISAELLYYPCWKKTDCFDRVLQVTQKLMAQNCACAVKIYIGLHATYSISLIQSVGWGPSSPSLPKVRTLLGFPWRKMPHQKRCCHSGIAPDFQALILIPGEVAATARKQLHHL